MESYYELFKMMLSNMLYATLCVVPYVFGIFTTFFIGKKVFKFKESLDPYFILGLSLGVGVLVGLAVT